MCLVHLRHFTSISTTVGYVIRCLAMGLMYVMMCSALIVLVILLNNCTCALVLMHLNNLIAQHHRLGLSGYGFAQIPLRLDKAAKRGNNNVHTNSVEKENQSEDDVQHFQK